MSVSARHPDYNFLLPYLVEANDCYLGQKHIKSPEKAETYLPPTSRMREIAPKDGVLTSPVYKDYLFRGKFYSLFRGGVRGSLGVMHQKKINPRLPLNMQYLIDDCTMDGQSMQGFVEELTRLVLIDGKVVIAVGISPRDGLPRFEAYSATSNINWFGETVVFEENVSLVDDFAHKNELNHRVLTVIGDEFGSPVYAGGLFAGDDYNEQGLIVPTFQGRPSNELQVSFINANNITRNVDIPPLTPLVDSDIAIYNLEAARRTGIVQQFNSVPVIKKKKNKAGTQGQDDVSTAPDEAIVLDEDEDFKFVSPGMTGFAEIAKIIDKEETGAAQFIVALLPGSTAHAQSADALSIRASDRASRIHPVVLSAEQGFNQRLRGVARWMGSNENEVDVSLNKDYSHTAPDIGKLAQFLQIVQDPNSPATYEDWISYYLSMDVVDKTPEEIREDFEEKQRRAQEEGQDEDPEGEENEENSPPTA